MTPAQAKAQQQALVNAGVALAACFAVYKFVKHDAARAMALGVAGVVIGRRLPFVGPAL